MSTEALNSQTFVKTKKFNIDEALNHAPISLATFSIVFAIALAVVLEAINNNLLGLAIPKLVDEWHVPHEAFKYAVTVSMIGMAIGAFSTGFLADKIGRRKVLLMTLPLCGISTILIGLINNMWELVTLRFFVSFGFGGLLPVASSMAAEFASKSWRTMAVTIPIVCISLGTVFAGFLFNMALGLGGWHIAFYSGGGLTLILFVVLLFVLPESPLFTAQFKDRWPQLRLLLRRLGHNIADDAVFQDELDEKKGKPQGGVKALFQNGLARDTIVIWCAAFFGIAGLYAIYMWLPTILGAEGVNEDASRTAMAYWFSIGGFIGAIICAWGCSRFGSRKVMILFAIGGTVTIGSLLTFNISQHVMLMSAMLGLHGLFSNGIQVPFYAIFAYLYPTHVRATGSSMASSIGKLGAIFAGFLGGILSPQGYFVLLTFFMLLVIIALALFKRHMPPVSEG